MDTDMHIITLDKRKHEFLLEQKRKDVFTQEPIRAGDRVIACGGMGGDCDSVYLADSWSAQGYKCSNCNEVGLTLSEIVQKPQVYFKEPVILDFRVNPKKIIPGEPVLVSWKVDKAEAILLNEVVVSGETQINDRPLRPTKYVLKARNSKGWAKERVEEVRLATIRARLFIEPEVVVAGQPTHLRWEIENATRASLDNGLGAIKELESGRMKISPRKDTHYTLTASNGFEEVQASAYVRLPEVSIIHFSAEHDTVTSGSSEILSWQTQNSERVEISGIGEVTETSIEYSVNETNDFQLELTAYGLYGEKVSKRSLTLKVARIESLEVEQYGSATQRQYRLTWQSHYLENLKLDHGVGEVSGRSETIPSSDEEIAYTLIGETQFGQKVSRSLTLRPAQIHLFEAFPIYAFIGMKGKLQWDVSNAQRLEIDKGIGVVSGNEHSFIFSEQHARLTLTAYGEINVATHMFELKIARPPSIVLVKVPTPAVEMKLSIPTVSVKTDLLDTGLKIASRPIPQFKRDSHGLYAKLPEVKGFKNSIALELGKLNPLDEFVTKKFEVWKLLTEKMKEKILNHIYNGKKHQQSQ